MLAAWPWLLARPRRFAALCCAGAAVSLIAGLAIVGPNPISPDALIERPGRFFVGLLLYYGAVTLPFLLAGLAVATPLSVWPTRANRLYAADLAGAGLGCLAAVGALSWLDAAPALATNAALFAGAGACYAGRGRLGAGLLLATAVLLALAPFSDRLIHFVPTDTKTLGRPEARDATFLHTQWSPVNRVDLYTTPRRVGGFWTNYGRRHDPLPMIPRTLSLVYDAHNGSDVFEVRGRESLAFLEGHLLSLPYQLLSAPRVLVIGVGGGIDVLNALYHGATHVTGVELQPITVALHEGLLARWTGGWLQRPEVELVAAEGRHFVRTRDARYDLIQITAVDTFAAQTTGAYVLAESYLYSVEAFVDYFARLEDDGLLSIAIGDLMYRDKTIPSPYSARLALVAREALRRIGSADPSAHILLTGQGIPNFRAPAEAIVVGAWIESLMVKKTPFSAAEIAEVRAFTGANGFAVRLAPDDGKVDRHLSRIVNAPDEDLAAILDEQVYAIGPITDDRPFFFHVLPWRGLVLDRRIDWTHPGSGTGQIVLLMMLGQALLLGGALIVLPLARGAARALPRGETAAFLAYFLSLGLGFLLIEISFVQKYVLLLGYPTYSLSVTIFSLLVFAAVGAALCRRGFSRPRRFLHGLLALTLGLVALEILALPWLREQLLAAPLAVRIGATVALQCPLGLVLGMYFPTGLELLRRREPRLIPWAWAVNGVASVAASVLAVMLGMAFGFTVVALVAAGIYALGTLSLTRTLREPTS